MRSKFSLNILTTYGSQLYMALIGIVCMPLFLDALGSEAYAFIGLFTFLQAFFTVFDAGLSPALARTIAANPRKNDSNSLKKLTRTLESLSLSIALLIFAVTFFTKDLISSQYLGIQGNQPSIHLTILLLIAASSLRFTSMIQRAGLQGFENFNALNLIQVILTTIRFPIAALILYLLPKIEVFFLVQIFSSVLEWIILRTILWNSLNLRFKLPGYFSLESLKPILKFSSTIALTTLIAALIGQLDKLIVANILTLEEYGHFALSAVVANGILLIGLPIGNVLIPRLTNLHETNDKTAFADLYIKAATYTSVFISAVALTLSAFPYSSIWVLTGNIQTSQWGMDVLPYYAAGNFAVVVAGFNYYLQAAIGKVKLHLYYNVAMLLISLPVTVWVAYQYGVVAMLMTWAAFRISVLLIWSSAVHWILAKEIFFRWVILTLVPSLAPWLLLYVINDSLLATTNRLILLLFLGIFFICSVLLMLITTHLIKNFNIG